MLFPAPNSAVLALDSADCWSCEVELYLYGFRVNRDLKKAAGRYLRMLPYNDRSIGLNSASHSSEYQAYLGFFSNFIDWTEVLC